MRSTTFLYGGIGKYNSQVANRPSEAGILTVRYSLNILHQNDHHQRIAHSQRSRSAMNIRRQH